MSWRPDSIREAVRRHMEDGKPFFNPLRELDVAYRLPLDGREPLFLDEPSLAGNAGYDAYAAAAAEYFALRYGFPVPGWARDRKRRFLKTPWFPCGSESLKAILLAESPLPFRRRLVFVDREPCCRPSRDILEPRHSLAFNNESGIS